MANTSYTQQALAADPNFQRRVANALASVAWEVLNEAPTVANHAARAAYARQVIADLPGFALQLSASFVVRTNVMSFETTYDFARAAVVTAAGDPDLASQMATDWNLLAGA